MARTTDHEIVSVYPFSDGEVDEPMTRYALRMNGERARRNRAPR